MESRAVMRLSARVVVPVVAALALVAGTAGPAFAAGSRPSHTGGGGHSGGGGGSTTTGYDVSWPQCGSTLPSSTAFGIVGVNDGLADTLNPCLGPDSSYTQSELYWAQAVSVGTQTQPNVELYVNTADPGNSYNGQVIADWPTTGGNSTIGYCTTTTFNGQTVGQNSPGCAWQYGYNMATQDAGWLANEATAVNGLEAAHPLATTPGSYWWWLDVETGNTWQSGTSGLSMNVADLQGMVAGLNAAGVKTVGVYSTSYQWGVITGGTNSQTTGLAGLPNWIPGARTERAAKSNCTLASFTGGTVEFTQWTGTIDNDYAC